MFCTTSVLEKCLQPNSCSSIKKVLWIRDTFPKPKLCKTLFLTTKAFNTLFILGKTWLQRKKKNFKELVCGVLVRCQQFSVKNANISNDLKGILGKTTSENVQCASWDELYMHVCTRGDFESKIVHSISFSLGAKKVFVILNSRAYSWDVNHTKGFLSNLQKKKIWA